MQKRTPEELASLLDQISSTRKPPVENWHPEIEVDIEMSINRQGEWFYEGRPIAREAMVKLFASILVREPDGNYYLKTPVEKARLTVEDSPFVVTGMEEYLDDKGRDAIVFTTNIGENVVLSREHGLRVSFDDETGETIPYLQLDRGLEARVGRNIFYELVELATQQESNGVTTLTLVSQDDSFFLGKF
ncbi:hypothetical protein BTA51_10195 [Hahella sp. CCB-MM4]|uniref:DUF1285 domain-containing protein n=1 Tax=Hahella sp. (strain CCB-MM4) TaxID=1926491 RepID=UPI000B9B62DB|nr:DUF1285 domain-containing protein [Hahella sp. CCB-MM4]OZG73389.1 hypothetical protein BTA51_10195 [Hahella sp. CCB-MM4]